MSLTDEERFNSIFDHIGKITENAIVLEKCLERPNYPIHIDSEIPLKKVLQGCMSFWDLFYGNTAKFNHWVLGDGIGGAISNDSIDPWGMSIRKILQINHSLLIEKPQPPSYTFDCLKYLSMDTFLMQTHPWYSFFLTLYASLEDLIHPLRYYDDEFLQTFHRLNSELNFIMGMCSLIFSRNDAFAKAYVLESIVRLLYKDYDAHETKQEDLITNWLVQYNYHHKILESFNRIRLEDLVYLHHDLLMFADDEDGEPITRIITALELTSSKLYQAEPALLTIVNSNYPDHLREVACVLKKLEMFIDLRDNPVTQDPWTIHDQTVSMYCDWETNLTNYRKNMSKELYLKSLAKK